MLLGDLDQRSKFMVMKQAEVEEHLRESENVKDFNEALERLFNIYDAHRSLRILRNRVEAKVKVSFGDNEITVSEAKEFLRTTRTKIKAMTDLIDNIPTSLNIFQLLEERDKLVEEFLMVNREIEKIKWSTEVD